MFEHKVEAIILFALLNQYNGIQKTLLYNHSHYNHSSPEWFVPPLRNIIPFHPPLDLSHTLHNGCAGIGTPMTVIHLY